MIVKIFLLATIAVANARHVMVEVDGATVSSERCPAQGHHLLPHEWDCTKFYYCEYGEKWVTPRDCAPGTEFSYELQVCVHPESANCQLSRVPPSSEESDESSEASTEEPETERPSTEAAIISTTTTEVPSTEAAIISTTTTEVPSTEAAIISTTTTEVPSTEAAIISTTTTEVPSTEAAIISTTTTEVPSTEAAIISTTTTEVPSTEAAIISTTTTEVPSTEAAIISTTTTQVPSTEAGIITTTTPAPTEAPELELLPNGCPADFDVHLLLPHETRCNKFYYCVFGEKVERSCAPGTHFSPSLQTCDWPENVGCVNAESSEEVEGDLEGSGEVEIDTDELLPNGCPADFDIHKLLPHDSDCSMFYYCVLGEKVERQCAPGALFNAAIQTCDLPENVDCEHSTSNENGNSNEDTGNSNENNGNSNENNGNSGESDILDNGCPADFDVHQLLPHESDCAKFYYCVFGKKVERDCSPGNHFNPVLQVCDRPEDAGCANSGSEENGSGESAENGNSQESSEENVDSEEATTTTEVPSTEAAVISTTTTEVPSTEAAIISTTTTEVPSTEATIISTTTTEVPSTEAAIISTTTTEVPSTEAAIISTTTTEVPSTEAAVISTTTPAPITIPTEAPEIELLPNGCPADFDVHLLLPHESDCGKFYYCVFGKKVERDCAPGTHFSPSLQVCDWPQNVNCENSNNSNEDNGNSDENNESLEGSGNSNENNGNSNENNGNSNENNGNSEESDILENGCPADFDVHKLLPHEYYCDKFYYCVFGEKVERTCAPGTHFNYKEQVCDHPENVLCVGGAGGGIETSQESSSEENVEPILPNGCPSDFNVHQLLPHEDCGKFYYCNFGEKVERDCAPGTHFNAALQVCDHPVNAGCANAGSEENQSAESTEVPSTEAAVISTTTTEVPSTEAGIISTTTTEVPSTEAGVISTTTTEVPSTEAGIISTTTTEVPSTEAAVISTTTTEVPSTEAAIISTTTPAPVTTEAPEIELLPNGCPADFDVHLLLPHESDCGKFYYCVFGEKVERDCAPGTHFSPSLQTCDWPQNVNCENSNNSNEDNSNEDNGSNESSGNSNEDNGNSNEDNGNSEENGTLDNGCPADFNVHQLLPHESDCGKFYYCVHGEKVERDCAPGTHFNPNLQTCDWAENVQCENSNNSNEDNGSSNEDNGNSNEGSGNSNESNGNSNENNGNSEENGTLENGCPADFDVHQLLPHESECSKFYYCVFGEKVERDCAPGTHFNAALQVCDHPINAGCANAGSEENQSAESTEVPSTEAGIISTTTTEVPSTEAGIISTTTTEVPSTEAGIISTTTTEVPSTEAGIISTTTTEVPSTEAGIISTTTAEVPSTEAGIISTTTTEVPSTEAGIISTTTPAPVTTEAPEIELLPNGCPADFDVHLLLPHESDCGKFYYCVFGEKVERDCAPGTHFSPSLQTCDWPQNVNCENSNNSNEDNSNEDNESNESSGNSNEDNGNSNEDNGNSEENGTLDNGCPADFNVHQLLPHESDCGKFYYCVHGEKVERDCAPGTHFNPSLQTCDWAENVQCENSNNSNEDNVSSNEDNGNSNEGSGNSNESNGNSNENNGNSEENGTLENGCPADFDVHQLLPHESECGKFYYCVFGEKVERDCAPGTHFNPAEQVCDHPENAGCANAGSQENGSSESAENGNSQETSEENGNSEENGASNENGTSNENTSEEAAASESAENSNEESNESDKCKTSCNVPAWAHEHDCDKFWRCDGENAVLGTCSEGLHFNINTQTCDFICNAGCVRDDVQSTPEHDGLKLFLPWDKVDKTIRKLYLGQK